MYTVTFYSFKGGVGRTMALVNMATQLAISGKRVLIVDFDLEAPGIPTFDLTAPKSESKGLVEYICDYRKSGESPSVKDYIYSASTFDGGGELFVMPAGLHDTSYSARLNSIDWCKLYEEEEGFLFFEDMKSQWDVLIRPDYVLVDSRTGHSDVEGICTRQLPDAVCLLFFPNDQNLQGLKKVVANIKNQNIAQKAYRDEIALHFVVSNVPDLDDEDGIIKRVLDGFKEQLGYKAATAEIHHYNSLSLLGQEIFVEKRPNSRLAKEYLLLIKNVTKENISDRDVSLEYLRRTSRELRVRLDQVGAGAVSYRIERILKLFPTDLDVIIEVAKIYESMGRVGDALALMPQVVNAGSAHYYAIRARLNDRLARDEDVMSDLNSMLDSNGAEALSLLQALSIAGQRHPRIFGRLAKSSAFNSLSRDDKEFVCTQLEGGREALLAKSEVAEDLLAESPNTHVSHEFGMANIALGKFDEAIKLIVADDESEYDLDIERSFNLAMAKLGRDGVVDQRLIRRVLFLAGNDERQDIDANFLACMAMANFDINKPLAADYVGRARAFMRSRPRREFSPWTFSKVSPPDFISHMDELELQLGGTQLRPSFCNIL